MQVNLDVFGAFWEVSFFRMIGIFQRSCIPIASAASVVIPSELTKSGFAITRECVSVSYTQVP